MIEQFYAGFAAGDSARMAECYHPEVHFSDPVFPDLRGDQVMRMWRALIGRATDMSIMVSGVHARHDTGSAHWTARYTFSLTGRRVTNEIDASFRFQDKLIIRHVDRFSFWRWSRMALGTPGLLLGWTPQLRDRVRAQSARLLAPR